MTNFNRHNSNGPLPSPAQIALALAIVKHKPADVAIKDHILQIRSFITAAKDSNPIISEPDKFFDSVSFWQQAYERSEAEQSKLFDRIYELEQRNAALLAKAQKETAGEEELPLESSKRKTNPKNAAGTTAARKRAKTQMPTQGGSGFSGTQGGLASVLDRVEYMEELTGPFMRHFYTLQMTLQKRPNRSNTVQAAINLSKSAADALVNSVREKKITAGRSNTTILQNKKPEVTSVMHGVESALQLLHQALGKITGSEQGTSEAGQVTYYIVSLYEAAMKALEQHCKVRSEQISATAKTNTKPAKKKSAKSKRAQQKVDDEVAGQITRLLGTMILLLDLTRAEHRNIFEGALFILLNRVGRLLCLFVFQDLQLRPDLRVDPSKLPLPQGLKDFSLNEKSLCAAKLEAKHLIWVLERALAHLETSPSSPSSQFTSKIRRSLQSTLLQAVYGTDNKCFQGALQQSVPPDTQELTRLRACAQIPEQTVSDWFTQEVWRLLGWEMLASTNSED